MSWSLLLGNRLRQKAVMVVRSVAVSVLKLCYLFVAEIFKDFMDLMFEIFPPLQVVVIIAIVIFMWKCE